MNTIKFQCLSNIDQAHSAWEALSPHEVIYDDWNFRFKYYQYFNYPLEFIAGYDNNELIGLLPLMWDPTLKRLDFFAGFDYMEFNSIWVKPGYESTRQLFIDQIKKPAQLDYLRVENDYLKGAYIYDYNYHITLKGITSYEDFLSKYLSSHARSNIRSQIRKLQQHNITISKGTFDDLAQMGEWNAMRFGDYSSFRRRPHWTDYIKDVATSYDSEFTIVSMNGKKVGAGLVLFYKDICVGINTGYDISISNLGKYLSLLKIQTAIDHHMRLYDAGGSGAYGWKTNFNLEKTPFYQLKINL